jgi:anti-sigma factor RsiW
MSCEGYDWKAYAFGELAANQRRDAEAHAATCEGCREELAHVRLTIDTLSALREEEVPRRIAFVSDKVFEPRWWETFLRPTFAAACVLAAAIVMHGYITRPAAVDDAEIQARINQAVGVAVNSAVADVERKNADLDMKLTGLYVQSTGIKYQ